METKQGGQEPGWHVATQGWAQLVWSFSQDDVHVGMGDVQWLRAGKTVGSVLSLAEEDAMRRFPQGQYVILKGERGQGAGWCEGG
jgi:hypothetical protein